MNDSAKARARDRLAAVGFYASLISHHARNRLATIRAGLELLQAGREADLSPELRVVLLEEMNRLLDDFNLGADMVRCDFGSIEVLSARAVADEAVAAFRPRAERKGLEVGLAPAAGADLVRADRRLLRQVLLNLLRNAAEALSGRKRPRIFLQASAAGSRLLLQVEDNGPGVPAEFHDRLFHEPVSGGEGRSALGLLLCRDAMVLMDGAIRYATPKGEPGARFELDLPLAR